jgi:acetyltransferase-like isoleucine patch superfamily enzyme
LKEIKKGSVAREKLAKGRANAFRTYMELTVGEVGLPRFFLYELLTGLLGSVSGGLDFYLRRRFYRGLFRKVGKGSIIGRNVVMRHPDKIELGENVTIDDNSVIDARGAGAEGVVLDDNVIINRNCMIVAKAGPVRLDKGTSIGSNTSIVSLDGVELGESVMTGGACSISAGSYRFDNIEAAVMDQNVYSNGPIRIDARSWLGTAVIVLDAVTIGEGAVIGASASVNKNIPPNTIAFGVPAKLHGIR